MNDQGHLSESLLSSHNQQTSSSFKDDPTEEEEDDGDTSSTSSSSSSTAERKLSTSNAINASQQQQRYQDNQQQRYEDNRRQHYEQDDDEDAGESRGLLSNMDHPERADESLAGLTSSEVAKKRQNRRRIVAGVATGVVGLAMVGPCTAVAAGVAGAMWIRRRDKKKQKEALTLTDNTQTELASLISPKAEI